MRILRLSCPDEPGIVADVASCLRQAGCNIESSSQFKDEGSDHFFMRVVISAQNAEAYDKLIQDFDIWAEKYGFDWDLYDQAQKPKTIIMVSQYDHCLNDLLYRWKKGALPLDIVGIVSNHETAKDLAAYHAIPFHHWPVTKENKAEQEEKLAKLYKEEGCDLIILARYMQILSADFCANHAGHIINIHHSFLPGFKGAKPYHQAYERGVKIIGATAHFVTADLDEGPIITQEIVPTDHTATPEMMQRIGQDTECLALAKAVTLFGEHRIFLEGQRTIIL